jgi:hypothetical protein
MSVEENLLAPWGAQGDVKNGPVLRRVNFLALEHGVNVLSQSAFLGKTDEATNRLIGDSIFRIVQVDAGPLHGHPLTPIGIVGKKRPQVYIADLIVVLLEGYPRGALHQ